MESVLFSKGSGDVFRNLKQRNKISRFVFNKNAKAILRRNAKLRQSSVRSCHSNWKRKDEGMH